MLWINVFECVPLVWWKNVGNSKIFILVFLTQGCVWVNYPTGEIVQLHSCPTYLQVARACSEIAQDGCMWFDGQGTLTGGGHTNSPTTPQIEGRILKKSEPIDNIPTQVLWL